MMGERIVTLREVQDSEKIKRLIEAGNDMLQVMGFTEHGLRHVGFVCNTASGLLEQLGHSQDEIRLAAIAGWTHDVGNAINRKDHALTGAILLLPILDELGMPFREAQIVTTAVGNHDEGYGVVTSSVTAALILADKLDTHRTRVRAGHYDPTDIHDRVNYSVSRNEMKVDAKKRVIRFELDIAEPSSLMEYFEIYLMRMRMCEKAAKFLGCSFELACNGAVVNNHLAGNG